MSEQAHNEASAHPAELEAPVRHELDALLSEPPLNGSKRLKRFLNYIVSETLEGRADRLSGYTIAFDVYDKPEDFNPSIDPIVRVEASRLRRRIIQHYAETQRQPAVKIVLRKGTYVPSFERQDTPAAVEPSSRAQSTEIERGPSIAVLPFENFSADSADQFFADGLTEETISNLARFKDLFVFSRSTTSALAQEGITIKRLRDELGVDFVLQGSVRKTPQMVRVTVQLIDAAADGHILSESFDRACTPEGVFEIQDEIALTVAGRVADRHGPLGRYLRRAKRAGGSTTWDTYNWIMRFYNYYATHSPELHAEVRDGLEQSLLHDLDSSDGWAALSIILLDEHRLHMNERPKFPALQTSLEHAQRAVSIDPENAFAYQALALAYFYSREFREFRIAADRSIELNPGHADALADAAFGYAHWGEWDLALRLSNRAIELSPVHPGWYRWPTVFYHLAHEEFPAALLELKKGAVPGLYWYHACVAALHALVGEDDKAAEEVRQLNELYPDFAQHALREFELSCQPEEWTRPMLAGLRKAGLNIE